MDAAVNGHPAQVRIFPDLEALSHAAATLFAGACKQSTQSNGRFAVAISGGSTPRRFYELLGSDRYAPAIDWRHVYLFWVDERCVPREDDRGNFKLAFDTFLGKVPVPGENLHRIKGEASPERSAGEYEAVLRAFFGSSVIPAFDLIVLGVGEDGHTASLFPGSPALEEDRRLAVAVRNESLEIDRITLTLPVLNAARQVVFLVEGIAKANALQRVLEGPDSKGIYPAALVCPAKGSVTWLIDEAAASLLQRGRTFAPS